MKIMIKVFITFVILPFVWTDVYGQSSIVNKAMNTAIENNVLSGVFFVAKIPDNKLVTLDDIEKVTGEKYTVKNVRYIEKQIFGKLQKGVTRFEFRETELIRRDEILAEQARLERAERERALAVKRQEEAKERERLAAIEREREEQERREAIERDLQLQADADILISNNSLSAIANKFSEFNYQFAIYDIVSLPIANFYLVDKEDSDFLIHLDFNKNILYNIIPSISDFDMTTFTAYAAEKEGKEALFLDGFNLATDKAVHFLMLKEANGFSVANLTSDRTYYVNMLFSTRTTFEEQLKVNELQTFYDTADFPKVTVLYTGILGKVKVELSNTTSYVIDYKWDDNSDLSCYDNCASCDWFGGKGDRIVEDKTIRVTCEGNINKVFSLKRVRECSNSYYYSVGSPGGLGGSSYSTEQDALDNFNEYLRNVCK